MPFENRARLQAQLQLSRGKVIEENPGGMLKRLNHYGLIQPRERQSRHNNICCQHNLTLSSLFARN